LIVAILSDGYGEAMSKLDQKKNKSLNAIILRYEYIMFWRRSLGSNIYLIWANYTDSGKEWKN
jgi:hypothetical protein